MSNAVLIEGIVDDTMLPYSWLWQGNTNTPWN